MKAPGLKKPGALFMCLFGCASSACGELLGLCFASGFGLHQTVVNVVERLLQFSDCRRSRLSRGWVLSARSWRPVRAIGSPPIAAVTTGAQSGW